MNKLTEEEKKIPEEIIEEMISYLYLNGLIIKSKDGGVRHIPTVITPSPIIKSLFDKISFYQIAFNKIINKLSNDQKYLEEVLTPFTENDNFVKRNLEISKKVFSYEHKQDVKLGIFRNDYLFDGNQKFLFFTEYNTIASSMGTFSDRLKKFYSYFSEKYPEIFGKYKNKEIPLEKANTVEKFSESMVEGIKLAFPQNYKDTLIVFVIQNNETNIFDQDSLRNELYDKYNINSKKLTLNEIKKNCTQDEQGNIIFDGKIVSLFYFRATYSEKDYPDEEAWQARELIELSTAIKVPDINTFLTTFKIFQYFLSKPEIIMHYCYNELILNDVLRFFGGIYYLRDLDKDKRNELFSKIKQTPDKYILKPMKEGGGNNISGEKLVEFLPSGEDDEPDENLKNSIIVEKIESPGHDSLVIKDEKIVEQNSISEYSIYGVILTKGETLHINKSVGFLVRTKSVESLEGGIMEGAGAVDLPCLIDIKVEPNLAKKVEVTEEDIKKYLDYLKELEEAKKKAEEEAKKKAEEEEARKKAEEEKKSDEEKKPEEE